MIERYRNKAKDTVKVRGREERGKAIESGNLMSDAKREKTRSEKSR